MSEVVDYKTGEVIALDAEGMSRIRESKLCLHLPDDLTFDSWRAYGIELAKVEKGVQWWIGDWWAFGGHKYGERARAAAEGIFGRAYPTLRRAGTVARAFKESDRRRSLLDWSQHAEVAKLEPEVADRILQAAEANGWSVRETRAAVSRLKTQERLPEYDEASTCKVSNLLSLIAAGKRFGTIYADPPWRYDNQGTRAATGGHYKGVEEDGVEVQAAAGMTVVGPFLEETHGRYVLTEKGRLSRAFQKRFGDLIFNSSENRMFTVEIKAEEKWTGNLFLEIWSNYNISVPPSDYYLRNGPNPGWLMTLHADLLFYHFPYQDKLVIASLPAIQKWAFTANSKNMSEPNGQNERFQLHGRAYDFRQKRQGKHPQKNLTVGALVPVRVLEKEVCPAPKVCSVRQLTMELFQPQPPIANANFAEVRP